MAKKKGKCHICGKIKDLTRDHIPQLALYPKKIRPIVDNLNIVLACVECNNDANIVDEILKVFVGMVSDSPWKDEMQKSVDSTLSKNQRLARILNDNSRLEDYQTENGDTVPAKIFKFPKDETDKLLLALERIVKALYFQTFDDVLVETHELSVFQPQVINLELRNKLEDALMNGDWRSKNQGTLNYCFVNINNIDTICVINIYNNIEFCFCIRPKDWRERKY